MIIMLEVAVFSSNCSSNLLCYMLLVS